MQDWKFTLCHDHIEGYKKLSGETWFIVVLEIVNDKRESVNLFWMIE